MGALAKSKEIVSAFLHGDIGPQGFPRLGSSLGAVLSPG